MAQRTLTSYQCPGEDYPISAAIHYGRMARFYPACRQCPHREDTGTLSSKQVAQLRETRRRAPLASIWHSEGLAGVLVNEVDARIVRRAASALGVYLCDTAPSGDWPTVIVGGDGRGVTADWMEATCDGLRYAACRVVDIGRATAASLAAAMHASSADGGALIGNAPGQPHTAGVKFWAGRGQPISAGGGLDRLKSIYENDGRRPARRWGSLVRRRLDAMYLASLEPLFHALRPLRVMLDCPCQPILHFLRALSGNVACTFLEPAQGWRATYDLGIKIDGDGEACWLMDERGESVAGDQLAGLVAQHLLAQHAGATVVLEDGSAEHVRAAIQHAGGSVVTGGRSREELYARVVESGAILGGGPSGRFWYADLGVAADALRTLAWLLVILSQSDRPLSLALREALAVNRCATLAGPSLS